MVAVLVFTHHVHLWHVYGMTILVAIGFWMFWPTINALVQELTPDDKMLDSNSLMLAAVQGGWLMAGADRRLRVQPDRTGRRAADRLRHLRGLDRVRVSGAQGTRDGLASAAPQSVAPAPGTAVARYLHELGEGIRYVPANRRVLLLGMAWALFIAAMMTQGVISAPLSERILHGGAVGYGWINAGWAIGAFISVFYASRFIRRNGAQPLGHRHHVRHRGVAVRCCRRSRWIGVAVPIYFVMGSGRGVGGIAHLHPR